MTAPPVPKGFALNTPEQMALMGRLVRAVQGACAYSDDVRAFAVVTVDSKQDIRVGVGADRSTTGSDDDLVRAIGCLLEHGPAVLEAGLCRMVKMPESWQAMNGRRARESDSAEVIIHIVHHGAALCGMSGMPGQWPKGHVWVPLPDHARASCGECRARALSWGQS